MSTFRDRLVAESSELNDKIMKLDAFLKTENFNKIKPEQQSLLKVQYLTMQTYGQILFERITWLEKEEVQK